MRELSKRREHSRQPVQYEKDSPKSAATSSEDGDDSSKALTGVDDEQQTENGTGSGEAVKSVKKLHQAMRQRRKYRK